MKTTRTMIAALIATLAAAPAAPATTIAYDPFNDGGVSDGADNYDLAWGSLSNASLSVAPDATIGSGNALNFNSTGTFSRTLASIPTLTLNDSREKFRIEFDLHMTVLQTVSDAIRFGFRRSTTNGEGNFDSYFARYDSGASTQVDLVADANSTFGGAPQEVLTTTAGGNDSNASRLGDTGLHRVAFSIQLTDSNRVDVRSRMDTRVVSAAHTGSINTTFDRVGFQTGGTANQDFNFDNYRITRWINRLDDTFDFATPTRGNDAGDPNDTAWYTINTGATGTTLTVVSDDGAGGIGSNTALNVDNGSGFRRIASHFQAVDMAQGDAKAIELSFDARIPALPAAANGLFRFGLFDSKGTLFTGDGQGAPDDDDSGYHVQIGVGTGNSLMVQEFDGADDVFLGGATANQTIGAGSFFIADTEAHFLVLRLTRILAGLRMELFADGVLVASGIDTTSPDLRFDEIAIGTGNANYDYIIDNVVVDIMAPTPAALPAGLGLLALGATRRRRRHR